MSRIIRLLERFKTVSIIGMAKNVGKTTVLNHILRKARGIYSLGLTSIGRDGEEYDSVTFGEKPRIYVEKGTYIATAKECFLKSDITKEVIKTTGINTPMGEIIIARALSDGYVDLGGPSINSQMSWICDEFLALGCEKVIIDGALGRKTQASPSVSQAAILATGAAISKNIDETVEKTAFTVKLLSTEAENDSEILKLSGFIVNKSKVGFIYRDKTVKTLNIATSLEASKEIVENLDNVTHVVIKGIVSDKFIEDVMKSTQKYKGVVFLVEDGTKLFLNGNSLNKFEKAGGLLKVIEPINVICVTSNPVSLYGYEYDKAEFLDKLRRNIDLPVFDVLRGDEY